jgi:branched-chain amino acid transport system substrate-binding protein
MIVARLPSRGSVSLGTARSSPPRCGERRHASGSFSRLAGGQRARFRARIEWIASLAAFALLGCSDGSRPIIIGFASNMSEPNVASVAQAILTERRLPRQRPIVISMGSTREPGNSGGALPREVDRALHFASAQDVAGVVGPGGSREALQTAPIYGNAEVPNVVPTATSGRLRGLGPWTFLLAPDDSTQGEFIGTFVAERLHARTAIIFYVPDEYGVGLAAGSAAALARRGVALLARSPVQPMQSCPPGAAANAYDDVVEEAFRYGTPDVIVLATRTLESACIARAARAWSPMTRFVAGDGALVARGFVERAGPAADSMYLVSFWDPRTGDESSRAFATRFRAILGREPRHDEAMFFDGVMLLAQAIRSAGPRRAAIRRYLDALGRTRAPYAGVTGPISFAPSARRPLLMTRLRHGQIEVVPNR